MKRLLFFLLLLTGCATSKYQPYLGQQQDWPVQKGAFATEKQGVKIYSTFPERPYDVLGMLDISGDVGALDQQIIWKVKKVAADAAVVLSDKTVHTGSVLTPTTATTTGAARTTAYVNPYTINATTDYSATTVVQPSNKINFYQQYKRVWLVKFKE